MNVLVLVFAPHEGYQAKSPNLPLSQGPKSTLLLRGILLSKTLLVGLSELAQDDLGRGVVDVHLLRGLSYE